MASGETAHRRHIPRCAAPSRHGVAQWQEGTCDGLTYHTQTEDTDATLLCRANRVTPPLCARLLLDVQRQIASEAQRASHDILGFMRQARIASTWSHGGSSSSDHTGMSGATACSDATKGSEGSGFDNTKIAMCSVNQSLAWDSNENCSRLRGRLGANDASAPIYLHASAQVS